MQDFQWNLFDGKSPHLFNDIFLRVHWQWTERNKVAKYIPQYITNFKTLFTTTGCIMAFILTPVNHSLRTFKDQHIIMALHSTSVLFPGLNMCTFKISYHHGTLPLSSPGGHGVNMAIAVEEFSFQCMIYCLLNVAQIKFLFSKGYELTFKEMSEDKAHDLRLMSLCKDHILLCERDHMLR